MIEAYRTAFEARAGLAEPAWLVPVRQAGMERLARVGFPSSRDEEWRFTPLAPVIRTAFVPATPVTTALRREDLAQLAFGHPEWLSLVFVNGRFAPEVSTPAVLPGGAKAISLADAVVTCPELVEPHLARRAGPEATPFTALNAAFIQDGAFVHVPAGVELEQPILLFFLSTAAASGQVTHPRNLFVVEPGARVSVVESYLGLDDRTASFTNAVTETVLGERAWMEHTRIQREAEAACHIGYSHVQQGRESHYRSFAMAMGGALSRHNLHTRLDAPGTEALLYGLTIAHGNQVADSHTAIHHDQPNCRSWEVYKTILDGRARGVFNGKVFVTPEAQGTDAKQTNRTLLLSDEARIDTKPQLEIFADDLPLFYFRSRGVSLERARRLLTYAFAAEVLEEVRVEAVRAELDRLVKARLGIEEAE